MSKLSKYTQSAGYNAGAEAYAKWMNPRDIKINPDIAKLFENERGVVDKIRDSMIANGFDKSEPLVTWKGVGCVVDGHTRLKAALEAGVEEILVEEKEFENVEAAKVYTLTRQLNRRNLTAAALLEIASLLDVMKGGGKSRSEVAKDLGVSRTTLFKAQEVGSKAPEPVKEKVRQGGISINQAYNKMTENRAKPKPERRQAEPEEKDDDDGDDDGDTKTNNENIRRAPVPVSSLSKVEIERYYDMLVSTKAAFEEIDKLLKEFSEANGSVFESLDKAENIRAARALAQKRL